MAYHYKLETLLTVRRNIEEQCQNRLAHELFVLENHKQHLVDLKAQRLGLFETLEEKKKQAMSVAMFSFYVEAIHNRNRQISFQENAIEAQKAAVTDIRKELAQKLRERKVVERLKEKDFLAYTKELQRKAQIESDEMAVMRFGRTELV
nr:flagellar export protein FliJ [Desulfobulbaceae bacterium]